MRTVADASAIGSGVAHHPVCEPVPAAALVGACGPLGGALPARRRERVHVRAEQREERRQHGQRDEPGERRDDQAADRHRAQEAEREREQRAEGGGDRDRAERHRAPGRLEGRPQGLDAGAVPHELLAVARDEQQAVVDREPEAGARHEIEREHGDRPAPR